jgi:hypothetical protein
MLLCVSFKSNSIGGKRESIFDLTAVLFLSKPIRSFVGMEEAKVDRLGGNLNRRNPSFSIVVAAGQDTDGVLFNLVDQAVFPVDAP